MSVRIRNPWSAVIVAFLAGCLVSAGLAEANVASKVTPASVNEIISACVAKKSGVMRVIDTQSGRRCKKTERRISFNQAGPPGPAGVAGQPGPTGLTGPTGPPGTGEGYWATGTRTIGAWAGWYERVVELSLEAGNYILVGTASIKFHPGEARRVQCRLSTGNGTPVSPLGYTSSQADTGDTYASLATSGRVSLSSAATLVMGCTEYGSRPVGVDAATVEGSISALQVTTLHTA